MGVWGHGGGWRGQGGGGCGLGWTGWDWGVEEWREVEEIDGWISL